jgi:signal transduction histidine kinase
MGGQPPNDPPICRLADNNERRIVLRISPPDFNPGPSVHQLVAYVADLELEIDRLRKQDQYLRHAFSTELDSVRQALDLASLPAESATRIQHSIGELSAIVDDLDDSLGCHPAHDQVIAIAVRPLVEQVFRWQQRLSGAPHATLHLELSAESINWFPARFRHIVDNLLSNALRYRDPDKGEARVAVLLNHRNESIELRVTDNGLGIPGEGSASASEFLNRSAYRRSQGMGVGLAVIKLLIEQSGGSLHVESSEGKGSQFVATLPRYDLGDYLT